METFFKAQSGASSLLAPLHGDASTTREAGMARLANSIVDQLGRPVAPRVVSSTPHLSFEFISGDTLAHRITSSSTDTSSALLSQVFDQLGRSLAAVHSIDITGVDWAPAITHTAHELTPAALRSLSSASLELFRMVQTIPAVCDLLEIAYHDTTSDRFIHNDFRAPNIVVSHSSSHVLIVDWEHAGVGSPARDLGSLIAELLTGWPLHTQTLTFSRAQLIQTFLTAYSRHAVPVDWEYLHAHIVAALFHTALSLAQHRITLDARVRLVTSIAATIASAPAVLRRATGMATT